METLRVSKNIPLAAHRLYQSRPTTLREETLTSFETGSKSHVRPLWKNKSSLRPLCIYKVNNAAFSFIKPWQLDFFILKRSWYTEPASYPLCFGFLHFLAFELQISWFRSRYIGFFCNNAFPCRDQSCGANCPEQNRDNSSQKIS